MNHLHPPFYSVSEGEILSHGFAWRESRRVFARSAEDRVHGEARLRERFGVDRLPPPVGAHVLIALGGRLAVVKDRLGFQSDQPSLGDASFGIEGHLDVAVVSQGGVRDLNEK